MNIKQIARFTPVLIMFLLLISCLSPEKSSEQQPVNIVPKPVKLVFSEGSFTINRKTTIFFNEEESVVKEARDFKDFTERLESFVYHLDRLKVNYAKHIFIENSDSVITTK